MQRRHFLQSSAAAVLSASVLPSIASASESDTSQTAIPSTQLNTGWSSVDEQLSVPGFDDEEHVENKEITEWNLDAFHGQAISKAVEEATPFTDVHPLTHLWTATVIPVEGEEFETWQKGESAEFTTDIDATTEKAFEQYMEDEVLQEELYYAGEYHRGAAKQTAGWVAGLLPFNLGYAYDVFVSNWLWKSQDSVTTHSEISASISQYYFGLPLTAISPDAEQHVENETTVDFRGVYIDWFSEDEVFNAAGAVYPENRGNLESQLEDGLDEGLADFPSVKLDTKEEYEPDILKMLREVRSTTD